MKKPFYLFSSLAVLLGVACGPTEEEKIAKTPGADPAETAVKTFNDLVDYRDISLDSLKKVMAVTEKPVVLYFSGFADVNSRKLEEELFMDAQQNPQLKAQTLVMLMVDDRNPLPENEKYVSTVTGDSVTNYGKRSYDLEMSLGKMYQPWLVKLDDDFKVLDSLTYMDRARKSTFFSQ